MASHALATSTDGILSPASLISSDTDAMTLHDAARSGGAATVQDLVDAGVRVDSRDGEGRTPLLLAAEAGHLAAVRHLLEAGAKVDAPALPPGEDSNDPPPAPILPVVCRRG